MTLNIFYTDKEKNRMPTSEQFETLDYTILYKGDNFCDFLLLSYTPPPLEKGSTQKRKEFISRLTPQRSKLLDIRVDPFSDVKQNMLTGTSLESVSVPHNDTVDSQYLAVQGTLWNTLRSVSQHIRFAELRKNKSNNHN